MSTKYNPQKIEAKWQKYWEKEKLFAAVGKSKKPKFYCLIEFPYPSGEGLHVGHPRSYTALDILARKRRMEGYNVLYPIGFDAFGLPSENYAIKTGVHPAITTEQNIKTFTRQLKSLGFSFDWDRVVSTTDPKYYKWTQWIFLKMYENGLAYKASMPINWCPECKTGLANEEVVDGKCERCGSKVDKKQKEQWMLKITNYAERLLADLEAVDYLERIKVQQQNWIGRSQGARVDFTVVGNQSKEQATLQVFTTRPDTLFGATFMVIAPEHELISNFKFQISNLNEVEKYIEQAGKKSDLERTELGKEKTGIKLEGIKAVNPVNNAQIPIFVADYVLISYGTGAIMAVPAHDQRDWEYAKKFNLPIVQVIEPEDSKSAKIDLAKAAHEDVENGLMINSGRFNGLTVGKCINEITAWLLERGAGEPAVEYKLRDWIFSRQRYWGEPIPIVYCERCWQNTNTKTKKEALLGYDYVILDSREHAIVPLSQDYLPLELPKVKSYEPTETGESPLAAIKGWVKTTCPICGGPAIRETDTMPNWAGSNWYFLRYVDPRNNKELADQKKLEYFMPVDWYNGGMEHTTLHLLYSRFIYKVLYDIGVIPESCGFEPYKKRTSHGLILGQGGEKMSKSKGNVVNPDTVVQDLGADTLRVYEMFMGPFDQAIPWDTKGVVGVRRFLEKIWNLYQNQESRIKNQGNKELISLLHRTVKKVSQDIETQDYNTAVSAMMIFVNQAAESGSFDKKTAQEFLKILSPFAPHLAEELWASMGNKGSVSQQSWPQYNPELAKEREIELVVQINGKVRDRIRVEADINEQRAEKVALEREKVKNYLQGKKIKNVIFIPGRLINFVI